MDIEWIRTGLQRPGKNQAGLARALGINPAGVTRILKGERRIRADELTRIEAYLGAPPENPLRGMDAPARGFRAGPGATLDRLPVIGTGEASADGTFPWSGETIDYVARSESLAGAQQAYALYVVGGHMEPRYHPGELIYVHPGKPVTPGCYVVAKLRFEGEAEKGTIKRFVKRLHDKVQLEQLAPRKTVSLQAKNVLSLHRIVGSGDF